MVDRVERGRELAVLLSCEHGGNLIPRKYEHLFENADEVLNTHRGYDLGSADLFEVMKNDYVVHSQIATVSRLLVDINRSLYRRSLFSEFTKGLDKVKKETILEEVYYSFRRPFEAKVFELLKEHKTVLHLSVHSFTPELNGMMRQTDFGILYHPGRPLEKQFAKTWKEEIAKVLPGYRVRFNYPFQGKPDGHVRYFRDREQHKYLGIEFEMNQKYAEEPEVHNKLGQAFEKAIQDFI